MIKLTTDIIALRAEVYCYVQMANDVILHAKKLCKKVKYVEIPCLYMN